MSNQYHTTATAAAALHNPHLTRLDFHTEKKSFATQPNTSKIESFRNYKHLANETCSNNTAGIRFHFAPRCTAELPYPESIILPDNPFSEKKNLPDCKLGHSISVPNRTLCCLYIPATQEKS